MTGWPNDTSFSPVWSCGRLAPLLDTLQGPNHTTSDALFLEESEWKSSCRKIDEQGAALAALPRAIWSEHDSRIFEHCASYNALLLPCIVTASQLPI